TLRRAARPEPQLRTDNNAGELALIRNPAYPQPFAPAKPEIRERVKELVRATGIGHKFACPVCDVTISGEKLVRHVDKHSPAELATLDPVTLSLISRSELFAGIYLLGKDIKGSDHLFRTTNTVTGRSVLMSRRLGNPLISLTHPVLVPVAGTIDPYS